MENIIKLKNELGLIIEDDRDLSEKNRKNLLAKVESANSQEELEKIIKDEFNNPEYITEHFRQAGLLEKRKTK